MRAGIAAALLLVAAGSAAVETTAAAETTGETTAETTIERQHEVLATIDGGTVTFLVRRTIANVGERIEEVSFFAQLPFKGVVRGMRVRAHGVWDEGVLLASKEALDRYQRETRRPDSLDQQPALLTWAGVGQVHARIYPVAAGESVVLEYTVLAPTTREDGRYQFSYPEADAGELPPTLTVTGSNAARRIWIDGLETAADTAVSLGAPLRKGERVAKSLVYAPLTATRVALSEADAKNVRLFFTHPDPSELKVVVINPAGRSQVVELDGEAASGDTIKLDPDMLLDRVGTWRLAVADLQTKHRGTLHGWRLELGESEFRSRRAIRLPDAREDAAISWNDAWEVEVELDPGRIEAVYSAAPLAPAKIGDTASAMARLHLDLPAAISKIPDDLRVVFVVDVSRSRTTDEVKQQLDIAEAYLRHAPSARFEVVRFERRASRLLKRFAPAAEFHRLRQELASSGSFDRANGSNLEPALALCVRALSEVKGSARVVVLSDGLMRSSYSTASARKALAGSPRSLVLHAAEAGWHSSRLEDHPLTELAAAFGGIAMRVESDFESGDPEAIDALELVRPIRIDHLRVDAALAAKLDSTSLDEGDGLRIAAVTTLTTRAELKGQLWSRPITIPLRSRDGGELAAALTFGEEDMLTPLAPAQIEPLARVGRVVSEETSFLTVRPGERPEEGWGFGRLRGVSSSCCGHHAVVLKSKPTLVGAEVFADAHATCVERVAPNSASATLHVETTGFEIVDVRVKARSAPFARCLEEEAWKVELTASYNQGELQIHTIALPLTSP